MILAFAATAIRPTAVLTGPRRRIGDWPGPTEPDPAGPHGMVRAGRRISPDRHGGSGVEQRSAASAPADPLRHRGRHHLVSRRLANYLGPFGGNRRDPLTQRNAA